MSEPGTWRSVADIDWRTWQPVDRATLLFVVADDQILLIRKKRGLGAGKINGPGGRLDAGEAIPLWFPIDQIPYDEMWADNRHWLPLMLAGRRFHGRFIFDQDEMLDYRLSELNEETPWSG